MDKIQHKINLLSELKDARERWEQEYRDTPEAMDSELYYILEVDAGCDSHGEVVWHHIMKHHSPGCIRDRAALWHAGEKVRVTRIRREAPGLGTGRIEHDSVHIVPDGFEGIMGALGV